MVEKAYDFPQGFAGIFRVGLNKMTHVTRSDQLKVNQVQMNSKLQSLNGKNLDISLILARLR